MKGLVEGIIGGVGCLVVVGVLLLGSVGVFAGGLAWRYYTAEIKGKVDAKEQIESGSNRIAQYEHFFNLCASVQSNEQQIKVLEQQLINEEDADTQSIIRTYISGVHGARTRGINQYNVDAQKYTQDKFRDSDLPYQLNANAEVTSCGN